MKHSDLTAFRLKLSAEAIEAADLLLKNKKNRTSVNRMYFSIYYAILALADKNHCHTTDFKKLKQWLKDNFVDKKTFFDSDVSLFSQIHQQSQELDYTDFSEISEETAAGLFEKTKSMISKIEKLISVKLETEKKVPNTDTYNNNDKILVPWDFSPVAENALEHAIQFAEITGGYITLVHLVKKKKEVAAALKKLNEVAETAKAKFEKISEVIVKEGNIFDNINEIADELEAKMVIMGTHGITGMQKFTGSKALKVISGTQIPFVVIQDKPASEHIKNIILPIDSRKEVRQKMNQVKFISKHYNVKFHLCVPTANSSENVKKSIKNNSIFIQSFLKQHDIDFEIYEFDKLNDSVSAVNLLMEQISADLILIITTKDIATSDYILGADEQKIIANSQKVPVMCISPIKAKRYSFSSAGA